MQFLVHGIKNMIENKMFYKVSKIYAIKCRHDFWSLHQKYKWLFLLIYPNINEENNLLIHLFIIHIFIIMVVQNNIIMQYLFTIFTYYYYLTFSTKSVNSETLKYSLKCVLRGTLTQPAGKSVYIRCLHNNIIL